jgi:transposase
MKRFVEGEDRRQGVLLPEYLDDYVSEENPVRVIDVFVDELDLEVLGFEGVVPEATGRPGYHPGALLKIYVYGYINQIASSRRLERETQRNVEMMWLTGRLAPDFKTIADFRKDNGPAIRATCRRFIDLCRRLDLFTHAVAAIDGSKFKAVNARDKNFTKAKLKKRMDQVGASMGRYMAALETADRQEGELAQAKYVRLQEKIAALREQMAAFKALDAENRNQPLRRSSDAPPQPRSHTASATSGRLDQSVFERVYVGTLAAARRTAPALPQTSGSDWTHNSPVTKYQDTLTPPCPSIVGRRDDDGWTYLLPQPKRFICIIAESVRSLLGFISRASLDDCSGPCGLLVTMPSRRQARGLLTAIIVAARIVRPRQRLWA